MYFKCNLYLMLHYIDLELNVYVIVRITATLVHQPLFDSCSEMTNMVSCGHGHVLDIRVILNWWLAFICTYVYNHTVTGRLSLGE